ncbi:hypothetical protein PENARI_c008G09124 [Penicillium arizonense]|uniref:LysM domain-containing protein n=1 Tax=Penicillium arizonense TaxID=1835702 RepID=A0A1F5LJN3_PENAI|nr:hypothetical protein PENARI_c008G09124 [Penicillium arizonense]OGE53422.1 hypothetical protein PENARI_c008G09124 [Penicillium arizonense]
MARCLAIVSALLMVTQAQQFDGYFFPYDELGLSDSCFAAVNLSIPCPAWVARYTGLEASSFEVLPAEQLTQLCESNCLLNMQRLRQIILTDCTADDVVMPFGSIAYPPTFMIDRYIYAAGISCQTDPSTHEYCDTIVSSWMANGSTYSSAQNCSACELSVLKRQLESPFGYSDEAAEDFVSLTSSCGATGYDFATPTAYALNATSTGAGSSASATASSSCSGFHTVEKEESCVTVSEANNVSTYGLIASNALDAACNSISEGRNLCLPSTCKTYQLGLSDTCESLISSLDITMAQLLAWNPMINTGCSNLASWIGWYLCASSPSGTITVNAGTAVTTAAPVPTDAQPQTNTDCGTWHEVVTDEDCSTISLKYAISLSDFYFLNPQVDSTCSNLWANTSYCVQAVGNIATYSGYPVTTVSYTFTKPASTTYTPTPIATATLQPTASGTIGGCSAYQNAFGSNVANVTYLNACDGWAVVNDVTVDELLRWNPSLSSENCVFEAGYSYCVDAGETTTSELPYHYCFAPNTSLIASTSAQPADYIFNCTMFKSLFDVDITDVVALNPWISSDCDGVWDALSSDGYEQICVMGSSTPSHPSSSSASGSTATATTTGHTVTSTTAAPSLPAISQLPQCGQTCFDNMLSKYSDLGCSTLDPSCLCRNMDFYYGIRDCSNGACGTKVASTVLSFETEYCSSAIAAHTTYPTTFPAEATSTTTTSAPAAITTGPTAITDLPTCGQTCFNNMLGKYASLGCTGPDPSCVCQNMDFYYGIRDCANAACGSGDASTVMAFESSYCASATASN